MKKTHFVLASVALGSALASTPHATAQRRPAQQAASAGAAPFEAHQRELQTEVSGRARSHRAMLPLLELWRGWNDARPETTRAALDALASDRRSSPAVRMYAAQLAARARLRMGDVEGSRRAFQELGYISQWRVVGPFDNEGKTGFAREYEPERLRMAPFDLSARFEGREREEVGATTHKWVTTATSALMPCTAPTRMFARTPRPSSSATTRRL